MSNSRNLGSSVASSGVFDRLTAPKMGLASTMGGRDSYMRLADEKDLSIMNNTVQIEPENYNALGKSMGSARNTLAAAAA